MDEQGASSARLKKLTAGEAAQPCSARQAYLRQLQPSLAILPHHFGSRSSASLSEVLREWFYHLYLRPLPSSVPASSSLENEDVF